MQRVTTGVRGEKMNREQGESELRKSIIDIGKRMWAKGFVAANDGNISVRIGENMLLTTPTGVSKGFMTEEMILTVTLDGEVISGETPYRPSSEIRMHLQVYRDRKDVNAVVHAHPPHATSFAVAGIPLDQGILPEAVLTLGNVPLAAYATPSTEEVPEAIRAHIQVSDAILLSNHGALTLGPDLLSAWFRMETLEHTAHVTHLAMGLGTLNRIPEGKIEQLMRLKSI